eukprot:4796205-Pyramimonas_sp.AAC.1
MCVSHGGIKRACWKGGLMIDVVGSTTLTFEEATIHDILLKKAERQKQEEARAWTPEQRHF